MGSKEPVQQALEAGGIGVWHWDIGTGKVAWSATLESIHGMLPDRFRGDFAAFVDDVHPDDRRRVEQAVADAVNARSTYVIQYRLRDLPGRQETWLEARGLVIREGGVAVAMTGVCRDITRQKTAERELERRLLQQEAIASLGHRALESGSLQDLFAETTRLVADRLDADLVKIMQLERDGETLLLRAGVGWQEGLVGRARVGAETGSQAAYCLSRAEPVIVTDLATEDRFTLPPLLRAHGAVSGISVIILGEQEQPYGVLGVHSTRRRDFSLHDVNFVQAVANVLAGAIRHADAVQRRTLLLQELQHRAGNLYSQILSIYRQSARSADNIDDLSRRFETRVYAMAAAQAMIAEDGWTLTPLEGLLHATLAAYADQIDMSGPAVMLTAHQAFSFSMALHELATNASKYGCFHRPGGRLSLSWSLSRSGETSGLSVVWHEQLPAALPHAGERDMGAGFGMNLIRTVVEQQLRGSVTMHFGRTGLIADLSIPLDAEALAARAEPGRPAA